MPARKSNVSATSAAEDAEAHAPKDAGMSIADFSLPKTMIQRLAKGVLPQNTQIQKDALLAMSKSATVFVNYLTAHANECAIRAGKKTIQPGDVLDAIQEIEFEAFLPQLKAELEKYTAVQCDKRNTYRKKIREDKKAQVSKSDSQGETSEDPAAVGRALASNGKGDDSPPAAKKFRRSSADANSDGDSDAGSRTKAEVDGQSDMDDEVQSDREADEDVDEDEDEGEEEEEEEEEEEQDGDSEPGEDALESNSASNGEGDEALDEEDSD